MGIEKSIQTQHDLRVSVLNRGERWRLYSQKVKPAEGLYTRYWYERLTEILFILLEDDFCFRVDEFRESLKQYRKKNWKSFHKVLEEVFNEDHQIMKLKGHKDFIEGRDVPFSVNKYRQCEVCGRVFYCLASNGKTNVCQRRCEKVRDNARKPKRYDGQFHKLSSKTRKKYEEEMFFQLDMTPEEDTPEWGFHQFVLSQPQQSEEFEDPQDIVCGTPPTHRSSNSFKSHTPMIRAKDSRGRTVHKVDVNGGEVITDKAFKVFEKNILEIKKELPKIPKNPLQ